MWEEYEFFNLNIAPLTCIENLAHPEGSGLHMKRTIQEKLI